MIKNMNKTKMLVMTLLVAILVAMLPTTEAAAKQKYKTKTENGKKYIIMGKTEQDGDKSNGDEPVEWEILDEDENGILVVSRYVLTSCRFNKFHYDVTWESCDLREWLNDVFYKSVFNKKERKKIKTVELKNTDNPYYHTDGGSNTKDKIFCLSFDEILKYYKFNSYDKSKYNGYSQDLVTPYTAACKNALYTYGVGKTYYRRSLADIGYSTDMIGKSGCYWWLRTPDKDNQHFIAVGYCGRVGSNAYNFLVDYSDIGVRPAMYLKK